MARYFVRPSSNGWVEGDYFAPEANTLVSITVHDHEAIDTGLLDSSGDMIWRAPNPMGFGRDEEWG